MIMFFKDLFGKKKKQNQEIPLDVTGSQKPHPIDPEIGKLEAVSIHEGTGFDGITMCSSKKEDVIAVFGKADEVKHGGFGYYNLRYGNRGLTICYDEEKEGVVCNMRVSAPRSAKTLKGIQLNHSTLDDVLSAYGLPTHAFMGNEYDDDLSFEYTSLGIVFTIKKDHSLSFKYPLSRQYKELHRQKKIVEIGIFEPVERGAEDAGIEDIFADPKIEVAGDDIFEVSCAHCGKSVLNHGVYRETLAKASKGEVMSTAFGIEVSGLITRCILQECRRYSRVIPSPDEPTQFKVIPYPTKEEERSFENRYQEIFPYGCPDCNPPKKILVDGFHDARKIVEYDCCDKKWTVSVFDNRFSWSHTYDDSSYEVYLVETCPECKEEKSFYDSCNLRYQISKCKKCDYSVSKEIV